MLSNRVLPFTLLAALLLLLTAVVPCCHAAGSDDNSLTPLSDLAKKVQNRGGGGSDGGGIVHSFLIPLAELVLDPHSAYYRRQKQTSSSSTKIGETKKGGSGLRPLPSASFCREEGASACEDIETLKKLSPNKVEVVVRPPPTAAQEHDEAAEEEGQQHEDDDGERLHFVFTEVSVSKNSAGKKLRKGICRISLKSSSSSAKPHDAEEAKLLEEAAESEDEDEEEEELSFHYSSDSSSEDPVFDLLRSTKTASSDKTKKTSKKNKKADIVGSVRLVLPEDSTTQHLLRKFHFTCTSSRLCKQYLSGTWTLGMGNEYQLRYILAVEQGEIGTSSSSLFSFFFQRWLKMPFGVSVVFGLFWAYNAVERWRAARRASSSAGGSASSSLKQE